MPIKDLLKNIEEIGIYGEELKDEIEEAVAEIGDKPYLADEVLIKLNKKLETAKGKGINIDKYNKLIFNFRLTLLNSNIESKKRKFKNAENFGDFDFNDIKKEYSILLKTGKITPIIEQEYIEFTNLVEIEKLKFKIKGVVNNDDLSGYEFEKIMDEISDLEKKGIDISEVQDLIMQ